MIIKNARVYKENNLFESEDIFISGDRFLDGFSASDEMQLDATSLYAIPGLTDIHFHGCQGWDFCDDQDEAISQIASYQARHGITTICPATMTLPIAELESVLKRAAVYENKEGAILCGVHLEGPFLSPKRKGAQKEEDMRTPDVEVFNQLQKAAKGMIKLISIAPELPGAMDFIQRVKGETKISLAHTQADYETARRAFLEGASHVTHLYNAMPTLNHRNPGVIGAAIDTPDCSVELICDGIHIHPSVIRATFGMFGDDKIVLVSDSMRAAGMPDGEYTLGGLNVLVTGKKATLVSDGNLAGSVTNLMDALTYLVSEVGIPLTSAVKCAAVNSAKAIGIYDQYGSISPGKIANLVLMDTSLKVKAVILKGQLIYSTL
ncbi:MAG: N-acetylglucosamine-6-phosphate deacetylase [Clostridiales bacterium]|nr:N-acetylglucosamine-6-phosphate deacetylase [Clostridiales bacterium]